MRCFLPTHRIPPPLVHPFRWKRALTICSRHFVAETTVMALSRPSCSFRAARPPSGAGIGSRPRPRQPPLRPLQRRQQLQRRHWPALRQVSPTRVAA